MGNSVGTYKPYMEARIKAHDSTIGYMGIITDYLLFEKNGDFHLKLMVTTWDYDKFSTEVKYLNYITTWGKEAFIDFCMDFYLLWDGDEEKVDCCLDCLIGAYCVVAYYGEERANSDHNVDTLSKVYSVGVFYDECGAYEDVDAWETFDFINTFKCVETAQNHGETFRLSSYIDDIEDYYDAFLEEMSEPEFSEGYVYRKNHPALKAPENPTMTSGFIDYISCSICPNRYQTVTENDTDSGVDYSKTEPPLRASEQERRNNANSLDEWFTFDDDEED